MSKPIVKRKIIGKRKGDKSTDMNWMYVLIGFLVTIWIQLIAYLIINTYFNRKEKHIGNICKIFSEALKELLKMIKT